MIQGFLVDLQAYVKFLTHRWGQILYFAPENPDIRAATCCSFANLAEETETMESA